MSPASASTAWATPRTAPLIPSSSWRRTLITAGGLNGILNVLLATLEPGDEVVLTDPVSERLFRLGKVAATPMTNWGSERAADYIRLVFENEPCERLRGIGDRARTALL